MRLCDDCIYKNNCKEYQNKVIKTTPIDFDFFGCSDYRAESTDVFTRKEELSKEESEWLIDFIMEDGNAE